MRQLNPTTTGILCILFGIGIFSVQDLILKLLSGDYPLHQAMVLRSITALPCLLALVWWQDGTLRSIFCPGWWKLMGRGTLNFFSYATYYLGLASLPMGETVALNFTGPIFATLLAGLFLGEKISRHAVFAVLIAFSGMLLIIRPGDAAFQPAAILPVLGAFFYACSMVMARPLSKMASAAAMAVWSTICFLVMALMLSAYYGPGGAVEAAHPSIAFLTRGWATPSLFDLSLLLGCGFIAAIGMVLLTQAYRIAPAPVVAPIEYSFMFWGVLWGWTFWGDMPDAMSWAGIAVIIGAGLYVLRQPKAAPAVMDRAEVGKAEDQRAA